LVVGESVKVKYYCLGAAVSLKGGMPKLKYNIAQAAELEVAQDAELEVQYRSEDTRGTKKCKPKRMRCFYAILPPSRRSHIMLCAMVLYVYNC
jgi:hypothetical protein